MRRRVLDLVKRGDKGYIEAILSHSGDSYGHRTPSPEPIDGN